MPFKLSEPIPFADDTLDVSFPLQMKVNMKDRSVNAVFFALPREDGNIIASEYNDEEKSLVDFPAITDFTAADVKCENPILNKFFEYITLAGEELCRFIKSKETTEGIKDIKFRVGRSSYTFVLDYVELGVNEDVIVKQIS